ncbi:tetratricopeptide repeat protein [Phaeobacter sp.]|uniref:tetratricopeptide repeat protein n=1 Tax=Phaeobacter sp. TaxID=1902409 RepID=UPI0025F4356E|nr:tetratricopeptide repeat protein [Phaeobacter sp.]
MMQDIFGQDTSLKTAAALNEWNGVQMAVLAHSAAAPKHLGALLEAEPEFALAQAAKGMFVLLLGRAELLPTAQEAYAAAKRCEEGALPRERHYIAALEAWLNGRPTAAIAEMEAVLAAHPQDSLAMKMSHAIRFILGDITGMRSSIENVLPSYDPAHKGRGYLLGCHAFALEETGAYDLAEATGRQALWMAPDDAWGLHAVAHVHDMTGNSKAGLEWLTGREEAWAHCNNFRYHVWWHKALMHLDQGQTEEVLALYDREIRQDKTDDYRDISNATSLLMRLELEGVSIGDRWEELADLCANRTEDGCLIFADLHYLLALVGDHRKTDTGKLVQRIHSDAQRNASDSDDRMATPGCNLAIGLEAFGDGNYDNAFSHLSKGRTNLQLAGGSHAQRDVFERVTIDAGLRAGRLDAVEGILNERRTQRGGAEDRFALTRRALISEGRGHASAQSVPAE